MKIVIRCTASTFGMAARGLGRRIEAAVVRANRNTAVAGKAILRETSASMSPRPRASGGYEDGWVVIPERKGARLENLTGHAGYVEFGRRPGRPPPTWAIEAWLRAKGIEPRPGHAYVIARAIGRRGIRARPVVRLSWPRIVARAKIEIERQLARIGRP